MSSNPANCKYSATHEWYRAQGDVVTIGITTFAADELTDITFVALPAKGARIAAGKPFGEIESVKATSDLNSAVDGEVIAVNAKLADEPGLVNSDAFGEGWMIQVRMADPSVLNTLMDQAAYDSMLNEGH